MAAVAPVPIAPVELPSWRPGRSSPSGASAPCPSPATAVAAPLAAAVTTASRRRRPRLGRRVEGRPVSVVVEETDRHDLEGAARAIRDLGGWGLEKDEKADLKMGWSILM